ncbi:MAG: hypothetical protein R3B72_20550 [Polyangiaceae bacterium]
MRSLFVSLLVLIACEASPAPERASESVTPPPADLRDRPSAEGAHEVVDLASEHRRLVASLERGLPEGSADYGPTLAWVLLYKRGSIDRAALAEALGRLALAPHPEGDLALLSRDAADASEVARMPRPWDDTWGEVAMAYYLGELTREDYLELHRRAHPRCPTP